MRSKFQRWLPILWIVLCFWGLLQVIDDGIKAFDSKPSPPIDTRYAPLKRFIPQQKVGYLSDAPQESEFGSLGFFRAQYALAPHVLVTNRIPEYVIVDLQDPKQRDVFFILHSVDPFVTLDNGACLAKRINHD